MIARVDPAHRRPTAANHTATHLLHAALRARLGTHVRQAGSYVGPDKLRFDFTHGQPLTPEELGDVEQQVNDWVLANHPVRALTTTLDEARALGAMALFGEKYGDVVRMIEVGDGSWSRELCGGTHVRSTAEIGVFKVTTETSSAANVRRIEAVTGPVGVGLLRRHDWVLGEAARLLRTTPDGVADAVADREARRRELEKQLKAGATQRVTRVRGRGRAARRRARARPAGGDRGPEGDARHRRPPEGPARRPVGRRARQRCRRPRRAARGGQRGCRGARGQGRRDRQGGRAGRRRGRRRARHDGAGRRPQPGEAARCARDRASGDRSRARRR